MSSACANDPSIVADGSIDVPVMCVVLDFMPAYRERLSRQECQEQYERYYLGNFPVYRPDEQNPLVPG